MKKSTFEVLEQLEKDNSRLAKEAILAANKSDEDLKFILHTAIDPLINYGMLKFDDKKNYRKDIPSIDELKDLRSKLSKREVTGHAARDLMRQTLLCEDATARKWLVRTFVKNLRNGVSESTVNKIWPGLIFQFDIGLCSSYEASDYDFQLPEGIWLIEPKFDGLRCLTFIDKEGNCKFVSRGAKEFFNTQIIEQQLSELGLRDVILDGEFLANDWNGTNSVLHNQKSNEDIKQLKYYIFDIITANEWKSQSTELLEKRKARLTNVKKPNVFLVKGFKVTEYKQAEIHFKQYLADGYEGAVIKNCASEYPFGRSKSWLKWKTIQTYDIKILRAEEGTGRNAGRLGAFVCDYEGNEVKVGSGYSDELRDEYWKNRNKMIGMTIEVQTQEVTKDGSLRFPVFLHLRLDK